MAITLRLIGIFGLSLFAILFTVTFGMPDAVEESAQGFVRQQVEHELRERYQDSRAATFSDKALALAGRLGYEEEQIRTALDEKLPEKIAAVIAAMCGYDCEKRKAVAQSIALGYKERLARLQVAQRSLGEIITGKYLEIVGNLVRDLRIFIGSSGAMFLILLAGSFLKPRAVAQLFLPGVLLLIATASAVSIYLFGQDWFYTILYNDYMGWGYLAYIGVIFGFLMDVVFNGARVTTEIINSVLQAIGSALSVAPCG